MLSTDRLNTLGWILSLTSTARSCIWMCLLLLLSLAICPWPQQSQHKTRTYGQKSGKEQFLQTSTHQLRSCHPRDHRSSWPTCQEIHRLPHARCRQPSTSHQGRLVSHPKRAPQRHLQTTTHSPRYVIHSDCCHNQFSFNAPRFWMQVPS